MVALRLLFLPLLPITVPEKLVFHFNGSCDSSEGETRNYSGVLEFLLELISFSVYLSPCSGVMHLVPSAE